MSRRLPLPKEESHVQVALEIFPEPVHGARHWHGHAGYGPQFNPWPATQVKASSLGSHPWTHLHWKQGERGARIDQQVPYSKSATAYLSIYPFIYLFI